MLWGGDSVNLEQPNSKTRRGRVGHGVANTLTTSCNQGVVIDMREIISTAIETHGTAKGIKEIKYLNKEGVNCMWENKLEKFNFKMDEVRVFDVFAGIGALHQSLKELGIPTKITNLSEIDIDATITYAAGHVPNFLKSEFYYPSDDEMKQWLMNRNIGYNYEKNKSSVPRMKKEKLKWAYKASVLLNNLGDISKIKYDEIEDFDLMNFSFSCFLPGTLVLTRSGYKNIEDITSEDYVLTHTNTYRKVVKPMSNYADHIYRLKTMCSEDLMVTGEHPFYVRERSRVHNNNMPNLKRGRGYERKFSEPKWIEAKDLSKDYYVGVAINQESNLPKWNGVEVNSSYAKRGNKKLLNNLNKYFENEDFWWVVGRYLGDGWVGNRIDCKGTDIYNLYICCAKEELSEITDVLDRLNLISEDFKYKYYDGKSTYNIRIANVEMAKFLQQFGKYAKNKELTDSILNLPTNLLEVFLSGYMSADGCFTQGRNKCTSVSKKLIYGIGQCVAKVHNTPYSVYINKPREKEHKIEGRVIKQGLSYSLSFKTKKGKQDQSFYEDGYLWCPINGLEKEEYNGFVYNMEVEEDNSYTVNNVIVHNCTDLSGAGKQKGMKNEDGTPTRSGLYIYGIEAIKVKKPKYIMIENVKGLIQKKFIDDFYSIIDEIESLGYKCYYPKKEDKKGNDLPTCLNAKSYGIPQNRERIFVICIREDIKDEISNFPKGFDSGIRLKDILEESVDEKYYLSQEIQDRFKLNGKDDIEQNELNIVGSSAPDYRTIGQRDITYGVNGVMSTLTATDYKQPKQILNTNKLNSSGVTVCEQRCDEGLRFFKDNVCGSLRTIDSCGDKRVIESENNKLNMIGMLDIKGNDQIRRVYGDTGLPPALSNMQVGNRQPKVQKDFRIRKLTPLECIRLMGFTDYFYYNAKELGMSDSALYKQAGNSIVVNCLYYIFKELFKEYIIE